MRSTHEQSQQSNVTANHDESHTEHEQPTGKSASPTDSMNLPQTDTTASTVTRSGRISRPVQRLNL